MRISHHLFRGIVLAGLGSTFRIPGSRLIRELDLALSLGLDSKLVFSDRDGFHAKVKDCENDIPEPESVEIPVDHHNPNGAKYKNRFWVNEQDYRPGGPVFVLDGGEADGQTTTNRFLMNETSFFKKMVEEFHGIGITWEHRYYGESTPYPINLDTPAEHFQYLNNDQALDDLPYFAKNFHRESFPDQDLRPNSTPWIMVGGSYPGMRAAFTRLKYPDTIFAAFASSAPVQAQVDMGVYTEQIYRGLVAYGYGNCTKDLHAAYTYIDQQLSQKEDAARLKNLFLGEGADEVSNGDFTYAIGVVLAPWQSAGPTGDPGTGVFCDWMETDPETNATAPAEGFSPTKGAKAMAERFAAWPGLVNMVNIDSGTNCKGENSSKPIFCKFDERHSDPVEISWNWQFCSEWGYFLTNNWWPNTISSRYQSVQYVQEKCYRQFPDGLESGYLPRRPEAEAVNRQTGGWNIRPSNVYFSGGEFDPWLPLSVLSNETFAPQDVEFSTEIPKCGVSSRDKIFGYVMPDAEHCYDLKADFKGGEVSLKLFSDALREWLPCFKKSL